MFFIFTKYSRLLWRRLIWNLLVWLVQRGRKKEQAEWDCTGGFICLCLVYYYLPCCLYEMKMKKQAKIIKRESKSAREKKKKKKLNKFCYWHACLSLVSSLFPHRIKHLFPLFFSGKKPKPTKNFFFWAILFYFIFSIKLLLFTRWMPSGRNSC